MKKYIIEKLLDGKIVWDYKEGGNSMSPIIKHKQPVTLAPVTNSLYDFEIGDIVLVRVRGNIYTHFIKATKDDQVLIGNNHGKLNGWTSIDNVYGIVVMIDGKWRKNSQYKKGFFPIR